MGPVMRLLMAVVVLVLAVVLASLMGCARPHRTVVETQEVLIPVPVMPSPPAALATPYRPQAVPRWLAPEHPAATSALDPEGERALRRLLIDLQTRDAAWQRWATEE